MNESGPIRVFARDGNWLVDYASYAHGQYSTRAEAISVATAAAASEGRQLVIEAEMVSSQEGVRRARST